MSAATNQRDDDAAAHAAIGARRDRSWGLRFVCAAVTHCSRFRRLTKRRNSVRLIASVISHAWCARKMIRKAIRDRGKPEIVTQRAQVAACVDAGAARHDGRENRQQRRHRNGQDDKAGPQQRAVAE